MPKGAFMSGKPDECGFPKIWCVGLKQPLPSLHKNPYGVSADTVSEEMIL